jgi:glycosyltransferase involved in cell wall biosynthesis
MSEEERVKDAREQAITATLVVLPRFPSDRTGSGQRSRLLVEGAVAAGPTHVVLLDGGRHPQSSEALPGVASITTLFSDRITPKGPIMRRLGGALRLILPRRAYASDPALRRRLLSFISEHGIHAVIFRYARLFAAAGITRFDGLRVLVDVDDRDDQKYQPRLERLLGPRLAHAAPGRWLLGRLAAVLRERLSQASHVWFVTAEDAWPLSPATKDILPNVPYWGVVGKVPPANETAPIVLFVGIHDHLPNRDGVRWFLSKVWPQLHSTLPEARLRIVGRGGWGAMAVEFPDIQGVEFVGEVQDLAAEYAAARLIICPVREGGGSKIKLIEAAAFARPIVALPHAVRGFNGGGLGHVSQAETPAAFVIACAKFLNDSNAASRAGAELRDWQRATYSRAAFVTAVTGALSSNIDSNLHNRDIF